MKMLTYHAYGCFEATVAKGYSVQKSYETHKTWVRMNSPAGLLQYSVVVVEDAAEA
ncbi:hypothetical protein [Paenibacillus macquariensis]|uniref:hypothetical protein n=2 Tax=Paenibacillus macquariensis TaxID=948756 RepID=UPI0012E8CA25|nr:hypothetical protein [Paenibacillus macquariensis]MEC0091309.1 hypothetical protein [Paenibacillus macquariensis]